MPNNILTDKWYNKTLLVTLLLISLNMFISYSFADDNPYESWMNEIQKGSGGGLGGAHYRNGNNGNATDYNGHSIPSSDFDPKSGTVEPYGKANKNEVMYINIYSKEVGKFAVWFHDNKVKCCEQLWSYRFLTDGTAAKACKVAFGDDYYPVSGTATIKEGYCETAIRPSWGDRSAYKYSCRAPVFTRCKKSK